MTIVQWVNLEKDEAYAKDSDIGSVDRCGALSIKALFEKDGVPLNFSVRAVPSGGGNVEYNEAEQKRNANFRMPTEVIGMGSEKEVLLEDSVKLPAAGGNKYKLEAKDANGATVESVEVEAKRKLYYQFMHMEDGNGKVSPYSLTQLESHCKKYHVVLTKAGKDKKMPFHKTINATRAGTYNHGHFGAEVAKLYDLEDPLKKVGCVTVLSNYIASFQPIDVARTLALGGAPNPLCVVSSANLTIKGSDFLWYGLDDDDDKNKRWYMGGSIKYKPATSTSGSTSGGSARTVMIAPSDVSVGGAKHGTYGGYKDIIINIGTHLKAMLENSQGTIEIVVKINKTKGFSGGFSWGGGGFALTTCNTKAWWEDNTPSKSDVIWNHEVGHRMGMVAHGDKATSAIGKKLPDGPSTLYGENHPVNAKGHQGPHCEKGVTYNASTKRWSGTPGCVMFGATGTATASSPKDYCSNCTPIVRKLDLSF